MHPSAPMPPPPAPSAILEREANALSTCFKNAVIKTGQIYAFHTDARRLGIHKYAPYPPRTLTAALGGELEKFDQICDAIEVRLWRAISVLKRDLAREERRAREAEQAALAAQVPKLPEPSVETGDITSLPGAQGSPRGPATQAPMRRQSAISLSSLNRSALPPKLDLSSSSMRISAEEAALFPKGLVPSPVSLAPKSARPSATTDIDLMAAFASAAANQRVDIDLTEPDSPHTMMNRIDPSLGSSADKPIELDIDSIDMTNLFGESTPRDDLTVGGLFSPEAVDTSAPLSMNEGPETQKGDSAGGRIDIDILGALNANNARQGANLFGAGASGSSSGNYLSHPGNGATPNMSLVSSLGQQGSVGGFDLSTLDMPNLDSAWQNMSQTDMEALLNMSAGSHEKTR